MQNKSSFVKLSAAITATALAASGCAANTQESIGGAPSSSASAGVAPVQLVPAMYGLRVENNLGRPFTLTLTPGDGSDGEPHCSTLGPSDSRAPESYRVDVGQQRSTSRLSSTGNFSCWFSQAYMGVSVDIDGQAPAAALMQFTGPSGGSFYPWTGKGLPSNATPALSAQSPISLTTTYTDSQYTLVVGPPQNIPVITDPKEGKRILEQYCGTTATAEQNCQFVDVKYAAAYLQPPRELATFYNNCSSNTPFPNYTVSRTLTNTKSSTLSTGGSISVELKVPLVSSVTTEINASYSQEWSESVEESFSLQQEVPARSIAGYVVNFGVLSATGVFVVTQPDKANKRVQVQGFSYNLPLTAAMKGPDGKTVHKALATFMSSTEDCSDNASTPRLASPAIAAGSLDSFVPQASFPAE